MSQLQLVMVKLVALYLLHRVPAVVRPVVSSTCRPRIRMAAQAAKEQGWQTQVKARRELQRARPPNLALHDDGSVEPR